MDDVSERRRATRVPVELSIQIGELDAAKARRRGNLSTSGLYVGLAGEKVELGRTYALRLAKDGDGPDVEVQGRVVRLLLSQDLSGTSLIGAAFTFDGLAPEAQVNLSNLLRSIFGERLQPDADVSSLVVPEAFDALWDDILAPRGGTEMVREGEHMRGSLTRIRVPSLLMFFAMERISGVLALSRGLTRIELFVRDGQIVDAEVAGEPVTVKPLVSDLVNWEEGEFDFRVGVVERVDRAGISTNALLLDIAREADEAKQTVE